MARQRDGLGQRGAARAGDDPLTRDAGCQQRIEPGAALVGGERLALAGRAEGRDAFDALRQQRMHMSGEARVIDAAGTRERSQRRAPETVDEGRGSSGHGSHYAENASARLRAESGRTTSE